MSESSNNSAQDQPVGHLPVLPGEVMQYLAPKPGQAVLDCTAGRGGHGAMMIPKLGPGGCYIGLDKDPENVAFSLDRLTPIAEKHGVKLNLVYANFRDAPAVLEDLGIKQVNGLLADLGFASNQIDDPARGLSFSEDGPLDMRLDTTQDLTAEALVNTLPEKELADLIYEFGEERLSRRIARKIVEQREIEPIKTTSGLAELVRKAYPRRGGVGGSRKPKRHGSRKGHRIDPATRTFMALRIAVNDELGALDGLLADLPRLLTPGGRAAIISFHSLEDRRVKRAYLALKQDADYELLTRKPVTASDDECQANPRSRSAKMRVIEKPETRAGDGP